jgi:hypothetical protein
VKNKTNIKESGEIKENGLEQKPSKKLNSLLFELGKNQKD